MQRIVWNVLGGKQFVFWLKFKCKAGNVLVGSGTGSLLVFAHVTLGLLRLLVLLECFAFFLVSPNIKGFCFIERRAYICVWVHLHLSQQIEPAMNGPSRRSPWLTWLSSARWPGTARLMQETGEQLSPFPRHPRRPACSQDAHTQMFATLRRNVSMPAQQVAE